jgi:hypothetical protein
MAEGVNYRINLAPESACMRLDIYPPGTRSFDATAPAGGRRCGGYVVFTPPAGGGGRYVLRVTANALTRGPQPYRLMVGRTEADDLAPGTLLPNHASHRGIVSGGALDAVDVYRFDVADTSALDLVLTAKGERLLDIDLRDDSGRRYACGCGQGTPVSVSLRVAPGHYFVAVRSHDVRRADYVLTLTLRTITATRTTVNGRATGTATPNRPVLVRVAVSPHATGRAVLTLERFDPFAGWLHVARHTVTVRGGVGSYRFTPQPPGRWRFRADFLGSRSFAPSSSGSARLVVTSPLRPQPGL